ncbi:MAG TPA: HlyD family secretion protein [Thermoanaerobaculia bacterium]|jgi:membrane fusion protein (multidrug efflux system)|nr:HlyD family secretion protein [Thermoanaerobaculia bacterium]
MEEPLKKPHPPETRAEPAPRRRRRKFIPWLIAALVVGAGIVYGVRTIAFYRHHAETDDAQIEGHIDPVLPRVSGYVTEIDVDDNQRVARGDVLLRIDTRDLQAKIETAQGALETARAQVAVARANVSAAETARGRATGDLTRYSALRQKQEISQQQYDAARAAADAATAQRSAALQSVAAARAQVAQKQADLDLARLQLSYATVAAPSSGIVSKKNVEVGELVQAGQPLMAIVQDARVWVVANYKETQLRRMRVGQPVTFEVDAYPNHVFHGRVDSFAAATGAKFSLLPPDNATGNFTKVVQRIPVKIVPTDPPDPRFPLRAGMSVTTIVDLG